jgi:hypothetical protein
MKQLEIQYFFPLMEQMQLDLDFTRSFKFVEDRQHRTNLVQHINHINIGCGSVTTSSYTTSLNIRPDNNPAGAIEVTPDFHVYVKTKPNWLARFSMKKVFGWNWKDK